ncbi:MAG: hypothetical protein V7629_13925 [Motiliproteus sp.]
MHRSLWVLFALLYAPASWATDVASITACKPDAEAWICASWKGNRVAVYRSSYYRSGVEFSGEFGGEFSGESPAIQVPLSGAVSGVKSDSVGAAAGNYTLQLLACNNAPCNQRLQQLKKIPGTREVEIKSDNKLWQVLLIGRYGSIKSAMQAAGELMSSHKLRDKPWVRTLDSIARRRVSP